MLWRYGSNGLKRPYSNQNENKLYKELLLYMSQESPEKQWYFSKVGILNKLCDVDFIVIGIYACAQL